MGYTITEKILLGHIKAKSIRVGEFINARVDLSLGNDITSPFAIEEFKKAGFKKVFDPSKIALIPDHFAPNKDIESATQCKLMRDFANAQLIKHYYEVGRMGIEHALLPELGLVLPGDLVIGADSHTCTYGALGAFSTGIGSTDLAAAFATGRCWFKVPETLKFIYYGKPNKWISGKDIILYTIGKIGVSGALYKAMEFTGEVISSLDMDDRFTMCNMAIEAGAKNGIIASDTKTIAYVKNRPTKRKYTAYSSDKDANFSSVEEYNLTKLEPQVAEPPLPSNATPVGNLCNVKIDQVVIGSCTNGRISDLRIAARILKGKKVHKNVRAIIIPATQNIYLEAIKEGLINIFVEAGCVVSTPTCGPCLGGHMGILAEGESAISTTNRNFVGRMGHLKSKVYLASPAVAAASAIKGRITHPEEI